MKKNILAVAATLTLAIVNLPACITASRPDERACDNFISLVAPFERHPGELSGNPVIRQLNCTEKSFGIGIQSTYWIDILGKIEFRERAIL